MQCCILEETFWHRFANLIKLLQENSVNSVLTAKKLQLKLLSLALLAVSHSAPAAAQPGAGTQLQLIPPAPALKLAAPQIRVAQGNAPAAAVGDGTRILVNRLRVTAPLFTEAELVGVTGFTPGKELSLPELRAMAARIADFYHARGYFLAQAYLPAQDIRDGVVHIALLVGQYGKVTLHNQSRLADAQAGALLAGLDGQSIATATLERRLLLLADLPGVQVSSTLAPGASLGTSDLIVDLAPGARVNGSVDVDNQGNRYTGRNRIGATVNVNELAGYGDVATLRAFTSTDGLNYSRAAYQAQLGLSKLGVAYTSLDYRLGKEFAPLDANGTARISSVYGSYPLLRSRGNSIYVQLSYDAKTFQDKADATASVTDKDGKFWMLNLNGDARDNWGGGGASNYSLTYTAGRIAIGTELAALIDQATAGTNGRFDKLALSAARLQNLTATTQLYGIVSGQWASKNLDVSEKMGLGGVGGVRAYPGGEGFGDQGYVVNLELRRALPSPGLWAGQLQLIGFADSGTVTLNHAAWSVGANRKTLSGAGLGLNWSGANGMLLKAYYAHKLGNVASTSVPDAPGRFWLQGVMYF